MGPGHREEHGVTVELEVVSFLFAHQNENWEHPTPEEKDGLDNILFMSICSTFLFVLHPFITCVFPYCLFGSANQDKH